MIDFYKERMGILRNDIDSKDMQFRTVWTWMQIAAWDTTESKGFHESSVDKGTQIALMHSELSECLEALRKPHLEGHLDTHSLEEEELADVVIRIMDYAQTHKLDVAGAVVQKLLFNTTREPMHGGKKF